MIKKLFLTLAVVVAATFAATSLTAHAFNPLGDACKLNKGQASTCQDTKGSEITGSDSIFVRITRLIAFLAGAAAVILVIVAGFQYVLSNGDSSKISQAKNTIIYALVGIIIVVASQTIVIYVIRNL